MGKSKQKIFLTCNKCGYIQAVKSDEIWGCAKCKKLQLVNLKTAKKTNKSGKILCACKYCDHIQSVKGDVWTCYKCKKPQPTEKKRKNKRRQ